MAKAQPSKNILTEGKFFTAQTFSVDTLTVPINLQQERSNLELGFIGNDKALDRFVDSYSNHPHQDSVTHITEYASPEGSMSLDQQEERLLRYPIAAVKSNLLLPFLNVGVELPVSTHWSVGADYYYPWFWPAKKNKNCFELIFVSAEARYWFNRRSSEHRGRAGTDYAESQQRNYLIGHSVAVYGAWGYYDMEHNYHGHQGSVWSAGLDYVYALPISKRKFRLEFQVAVGTVWSPRAQPYNVYEEGGKLIREKGVHKNFTYFGPTKVGVSFVLPIWHKIKHKEPLQP